MSICMVFCPTTLLAQHTATACFFLGRTSTGVKNQLQWKRIYSSYWLPLAYMSLKPCSFFPHGQGIFHYLHFNLRILGYYCLYFLHSFTKLIAARLPAIQSYDETVLLLNTSKGDETAFRRLFELHWDNIYGVKINCNEKEYILLIDCL